MSAARDILRESCARADVDIVVARAERDLDHHHQAGTLRRRKVRRGEIVVRF